MEPATVREEPAPACGADESHRREAHLGDHHAGSPGPGEPARESADVIAYNKVAAKVMEEAGVPFDDLYSLPCRAQTTIQ